MSEDSIYFEDADDFKSTVLMHHRVVQYLIENNPLPKFLVKQNTGMKGACPSSAFCINLVFNRLKESDDFYFLYHTVFPKDLKKGVTGISDFVFCWNSRYQDYRKLYTEAICSRLNRTRRSIFFDLMERDMYRIDNILTKFSKINY